jgi:lipid-A-disaccharide synthase
MPSICLVAGDPSGDAHAAQLVEALRTKAPSMTFAGLGGPAMQRAGVSLLDDLTTTSAIGPFDAARFVGRFVRAKRLLEAHLKTQRPDLVILVDFGDFNLPIIAPLVKRYQIPILYYISPQVWAWGRWRVRHVRRYIDRMVVFFPFEKTLYQREQIPVTWVGHPLVDLAHPSMKKEEATQRFGLNPWRRTVGLLPGSREHEIARHLPLMLSAARQIAWQMPGVQFLLPKAPSAPHGMLEAPLARARLDVHISEGTVYDALQLMEGAMVASGTATLEAALCEVPMVVVYRASWPTYLAARAVIRVPHIAMVNVVAGRELVPEFIQHRARPKRVASALMELLRNEERCNVIKEGLREVKTRLGPPGAVDRAANVVIELLGPQKAESRRQ